MPGLRWNAASFPPRPDRAKAPAQLQNLHVSFRRRNQRSTKALTQSACDIKVVFSRPASPLSQDPEQPIYSNPVVRVPHRSSRPPCSNFPRRRYNRRKIGRAPFAGGPFPSP